MLVNTPSLCLKAAICCTASRDTLAPAKGRHSLCIVEHHIHKLPIIIKYVFWNEVVGLTAKAVCLVLMPRSWATVRKRPAHQPFLPEHMDWCQDQNHHLCQCSESTQRTADSCLLLVCRKLVVVRDGWLPVADVTRLARLLKHPARDAHRSAGPQLEFMRQTSALVQLVHTEAQLINAFCCSRDSLLQSAVDACQWQKAIPHQIPCDLHAHTSYWANFQCTHAASESASETVP